MPEVPGGDPCHPLGPAKGHQGLLSLAQCNVHPALAALPQEREPSAQEGGLVRPAQPQKLALTLTLTLTAGPSFAGLKSADESLGREATARALSERGRGSKSPRSLN